MFNIPVSNGELVDKYTILQIKSIKITDIDKLQYINKEILILNKYIEILKNNYKLDSLIKKLKLVNLQLWDIEDNIRIKEKKKEFHKKFINLARNVYITNDKRAKIKLDINKLTKSKLVEIKHYETYL